MSFSKKAVDELFSQPFNLENYKIFVGELFNQSPQNWSFVKAKDDDSYEFLRLFHPHYEDSTKKKLDVIVIKMKDNSSIEKARVHQRNIISKNFVGYRSGKGIQDALIVFYNEDQKSWRLSYIKQEFEFDEKGNPIDKLTPAKRFSFFVNPDLQNVTVKKNFWNLLDDAVSPTIKEIESAFSVEAVTKEFFTKYVERYQHILSLFKEDEVFQRIETDVNHGDEQFAENFVKKLLGQIVFIYFLQKKGWMGVEKSQQWGYGSQTYLRDLYNECREGRGDNKENKGINYFNDYLEYLFYATLNDQRDDHWSGYFGTKIPYLNGGLFEPLNGYHWKGPENIIFKGNEKKANEAFGELLDVFDRFNFTVYENDPLEQDVAVDPEMLGKIFENLLPENERKGKGSFYTPRPIVHYMCKEALKQYLVSKTGLAEERIEKLIRAKDSMETMKKYEKRTSTEEQYQRHIEFEEDAKQIDKALQEVKIVDPAVGSGAFPMGILKEIVTIRHYVQENILLNTTPNLTYNLKKEALQNCIYGVDIDPGAVEIAKLRFWLSLVVENDSQEIEPLPNLDYKIMQGNSLVEQLVIGESVIEIIGDTDLQDEKKVNKKLVNVAGSGMFDDQMESTQLIQKIKFLHKKFFNTKDAKEKKNLKKEIDQIEKSLIRAGCEQEISRLTSEIENQTIKQTVSGIELSDKEQKKVQYRQDTIVSIREIEERFKKDDIRPFFPRKLHFGEIFKEYGGFDIVIGNPPYLRIQGIRKTDNHLAEYLSTEYKSGTGSFDLYVCFVERAVGQIKSGGLVSFIMPIKWTNAAFGKGLRDLLVNNYGVKRIISFEDHQVFNASTYTGIQEFQKTDCKLDYLQLDCDLTTNDALGNRLGGIRRTKYNNIDVTSYGGLPRVLTDRVTGDLLDKLNETNFFVKDVFKKIFQGIATSKDSVYFLTDCKNVGTDLIEGFSKELKQRVILEKKILGPLLKGDQVHRFEDLSTNNYVIIPYKRDEDFTLYSEDEISHYPNLYSYLQANESVLRMRERGKLKNDKHWFRYIYPKNLQLFPKTKLVCPDISMGGNFALDSDGTYYSSTTVYGYVKYDHIELDYKYLMGLLNSKLCWYYLKNTGTVLANGYFRFKPDYIKQFPIINIEKTLQLPLIELVNKVLESKKEDYKNNTSNIEIQIDQLVYQLYGLTEEEIRLVEINAK